MQKMKKGLITVIAVIFFVILLVVFLVYVGFFYDSGGGITGRAVSGACWCVSCQDCNSKLKSAGCSSVELEKDIEAEKDCITHFEGKTLDCQNHKINGKGMGKGVEMSGNSKSVVKNCEISNFNYCIYISQGEKNEIAGNKVSGCDYGLKTDRTRQLTILDNRFEGNNYGLYLYIGSSDAIKNNRICDSSKYDIYVSGGVHHFFENICKRANKINVCNYDCSSQLCTDTCSSLGYECGSQLVCKKEVNCGDCKLDEECTDGRCFEKSKKEDAGSLEESAEKEVESWLKRLLRRLFEKSAEG